MQPTSERFKENARDALDNVRLQKVLGMVHGFEHKRKEAKSKLPEFDALRDQARDLKDHVLQHLDFYLERFVAQVESVGGTVHWAPTAADGCATVLDICRQAGARSVTKGKSMVSEEIGLNEALAAAGIAPIETDLGEYIIQLRHEPPSHIIAPAVHLSRTDVADTFRQQHTQFPQDRRLDEPRTLVDEARQVLRAKFLDSEVGITGANFLIAESGSVVVVTNEGNGDLTQHLPGVHIVVTSIEKVVPTFEDAALLLRLLARSATGQEFSAYTTVTTGPKRSADLDGPDAFHIVLVDNGRSKLLASEFREVLRCIRCGACMNHCPIYSNLGGHAYGWVYPGPIGAVLSPHFLGLEKARHLPNASTFCGRCEEVCPVRIPLPKLLRYWRRREFEGKQQTRTARWGLRFWAWGASHPRLYHFATRLAVGVLGRLGRRNGRFAKMPLAAGWTAVRDLPAPEGGTFHSRWKQRHAKSASQD